ncbi:hypothetical protein ACFSKX_19280, partial [Microbulbifer halophilus]
GAAAALGKNARLLGRFRRIGELMVRFARLKKQRLRLSRNRGAHRQGADFSDFGTEEVAVEATGGAEPIARSRRTTNRADPPSNTPDVSSGHGSNARMDGHKIYDPSHPAISSNPKAQYRFSDPSYRSTGGDVYFGENVATSYFEVRKNVHGKSLFVGDVRVDNMLDLTDPDVLRKMNIDPEKLTSKVDNPVQKNRYMTTQMKYRTKHSIQVTME